MILTDQIQEPRLVGRSQLNLAVLTELTLAKRTTPSGRQLARSVAPRLVGNNAWEFLEVRAWVAKQPQNRLYWRHPTP